MAEELLEVLQGDLTPKGVIVPDASAQAELERRGYGDRTKARFLLHEYEAMYLLNAGKLRVRAKGQELSLDELTSLVLSRDPDGWTRFLIYRDLRTRGYVAKEGFGFGVDFRVYDRGDFQVKSAKYVVFGLNEGTQLTVADLQRRVQEITRMGKEPIVAVVERRGEVIYYRVSRMRFHEPALR